MSVGSSLIPVDAIAYCPHKVHLSTHQRHWLGAPRRRLHDLVQECGHPPRGGFDLRQVSAELLQVHPPRMLQASEQELRPPTLNSERMPQIMVHSRQEHAETLGREFTARVRDTPKRPLASDVVGRPSSASNAWLRSPCACPPRKQVDSWVNAAGPRRVGDALQGHDLGRQAWRTLALG
jgi:hypothetical protein